jgi:hypothetical protein
MLGNGWYYASVCPWIPMSTWKRSDYSTVVMKSCILRWILIKGHVGAGYEALKQLI